MILTWETWQMCHHCRYQAREVGGPGQSRYSGQALALRFVNYHLLMESSLCCITSTSYSVPRDIESETQKPCSMWLHR